MHFVTKFGNKHNKQNKKTVMIVPVGPTAQYPILAQLVNRLGVSLKNVHFFNMDEYMLSPTEVISRDDSLSFWGRMNREFYDLVNPEPRTGTSIFLLK